MERRVDAEGRHLAIASAGHGSLRRRRGPDHHLDHGSNYIAMVYTDRIVKHVAIPSTGTVGDSDDTAGDFARQPSQAFA